MTKHKVFHRGKVRCVVNILLLLCRLWALQKAVRSSIVVASSFVLLRAAYKDVSTPLGVLGHSDLRISSVYEVTNLLTDQTDPMAVSPMFPHGAQLLFHCIFNCQSSVSKETLCGFHWSVTLVAGL